MAENEKSLAKKIAKANGVRLSELGLRFDKVALRLLRSLQNEIAKEELKTKTIVLTITAPIKLPARTEYELVKQIKAIVASGKKNNSSRSILGNRTQIRVITQSLESGIHFIGLVHNQNVSSTTLVNMTARWLHNEGDKDKIEST